MHGVIGMEAINLMLLGMEKSPDTHTQKHLTRTVNHRYADLLSFLSQFNEIDEPTLKTDIGDRIGQDNRTYKKYNVILVGRSILTYSHTIGNKRIKIYSVNIPKIRRELKRMKNEVVAVPKTQTENIIQMSRPEPCQEVV